MEPPSPAETGSLTYGRYQLVERIARGGMGEVWIAVQTGIGSFRRPIAVKLLLPHLINDRNIVGMFLDEARLGAQINHANVAQVYDVGFEHDRYFIAMELVRGVSLSSLINALTAAKKPPPAELVAYVAWALCDGLHVAHEQLDAAGKPLNLVHRDVTPHNVLVSVDGAVKLTDFGIAHVADANRSREGVIMGKLGYLAPEQIAGETLDRRVDVFAAGATLYSFAALERPFDDRTAALLLPRVPRQPLAALRPDLPPPLIAAIDRALAPDRNVRFGSARELRNTLEVPHPDIADRLGALVREACASQVVELEGVASRVTAVLEMTTMPDRPRALVPQARTELSAPPRPRWPLGVLGLGLAATTGVAIALALPRAEKPAPAPAPVPVAVVAPLPSPVPETAADAGVVAATPKAAGFLSVDAVPWGEVFVDGKKLGDTPLGRARVAAGPHLVVVQNPGTGAKARRQVQVAPGAHVPLRVELK